MPTIDLLLDAHAVIGESLLWEPVEGVLYWVDIKAPSLNRLDPASGENRCWALPEDVGAFALLGRSDALVALRSGLFALSLTSGTLEPIAAAPWDPALFRFNEGVCDAAGRFWVGCMHDPLDGSEGSKLVQPLQRWSGADGLVRQPSESACHNGMAWSADGRTFYLSHSEECRVYAFAFDAASGALGAAAVLADTGRHGIPDGAAVDEEGAYWCAIHGGGCLHRYSPAGDLLRRVELPVSLPTMCAFGGPDLTTLFISSASDLLTPAQRAREPLAGALLRLDPGVRGVPKVTHAR